MPFMPVSKDDMKERGIDTLDFVYITGDAYVDHPSFGVAIISRILEAKGVFIAVGIVPHSAVFTGLVEMDDKGYIIADESGKTSVPGIFAAGDVRTKQLRQIVTAVGDGANAVTSVQDYLLHNK